jgi:uncharacterized protein (DUF2141 family)
VRIALYDSEQSYQKGDDKGNSAFAVAAASIHQHEANYTFHVPYGTYAIKAYHDQDLSKTMPRGLFGKPKTDYGFSNNPVIHFGPPSFEQTQFSFSANNKEITIKMQQ